jgi:hypothetical protein
MMTAHPAPGLSANWLNAWLATLGIAVLVPDAKAAWTADPLPRAVIHHDCAPSELAATVARHLPTLEEIARYSIARNLPELTEYPRNPTIESFQQRAHHARRHGDFTLAATTTDLAAGPKDPLAHSPFNPPAPKGLTIHERLTSCRDQIGDDPTGLVARTLEGTARRIKTNGLGFDYTRIQIATDPAGDKWVDPVIEFLAFYGLGLLPTRGNGHKVTHRGWTNAPSKPGAFTWPVWTPPLSAAAIDGLLDRHWSAADPATRTAYESVPYKPVGDNDQTRGYGSRQR